MKKTKRLFLVLLLACGVSFISCGDDGGGGSDPDPYVKFYVDGTDYYEWTAGFSDYADGVPAGCLTYIPDFNHRWIALGVGAEIASTSFNKSMREHIHIINNSHLTGIHDNATLAIGMKVGGGSEFMLVVSTFEVTKFTDDYFEGKFTGTTPSSHGNLSVNGSFGFKRTANGSFPIVY
ncbi:MAG: hypothetical protein FWG92_05430 [Leptospirales bacterium]|nr:hypothetical protein [Leptospirales bacterium]